MLIDRFFLLAPRLAGPLLGISLLAVGVAGMFRHQDRPRPVAYRLHLSAPEDAHCYYGTAWETGPVITEEDPHARRTQYIRRFRFIDGCYWQATETLVPQEDGSLAYEYDEHVLSCLPGAIPAATCPRQGVVTVEPIASGEPVEATPTVANTHYTPRAWRWHHTRSPRYHCGTANETAENAWKL